VAARCAIATPFDKASAITKAVARKRRLDRESGLKILCRCICFLRLSRQTICNPKCAQKESGAHRRVLAEMNATRAELKKGFKIKYWRRTGGRKGTPVFRRLRIPGLKKTSENRFSSNQYLVMQWQ
jgi:hypothetical protein